MVEIAALNSNCHPELVSPSDLQGTPCQARSDDKKLTENFPSKPSSSRVGLG